MSDDTYEKFVRELQKVGVGPLTAAYLHKREKLIGLLDAEARRGNLTLVLGAGVSVPSGLRDWDAVTQELIAAVMPGRKLRGLAGRLANMDLPAYRRTRIIESLSAAFRLTVRDTLYPKRLRANKTLAAIARLARRSQKARKKLFVISYNFDDLLERHLDAAGLSERYLVVESREQYERFQKSPAPITIFHPHGYMPLQGDLETLLNSMLIFSERQYHRSYFDQNHWTNVVQRNLFSSSACLFAGCSFNDQNLRRLLDQSAVSSSPCLAALMKRSSKFGSRAMNENTDYIIQHDLGLFDVKTLWMKSYNEIGAILDQFVC